MTAAAPLPRAAAAQAAAAVALVALLAAAGPAPGQLLRDVTAEAGLDFVHFNGMTGELYLPEIMGASVALLDYDGDGDLDLYVGQGALLGAGKTMDDALLPAPGGETIPTDRLYRTDLLPLDDPAGDDPAGDDPAGAGFRLVDVTAEAGLSGATGYGMGVASGDFDGDGWVDLFITNLGPDQLWRNRGDGTFEEIGAAAGIAGGDRWTTSAAAADYDGDGDLDLFVTAYLIWAPEDKVRCVATSSREDYCGPSSYPPAADRLYRNRGDGTFDDVSAPAGIAAAAQPGLGVVAADFNGDGRTDFFVANDGHPNQLWLQGKDGSFVDDGLLSGVAVNYRGMPEASMGIAAGDADGDGDIDLFLTHLDGETNTLLINQGGGLFEDRTVVSGLGAGSVPRTAFGTGWLDLENDGLPDLFIANGAVHIIEEQAQVGAALPLAEPQQLFRNLGGGRFEEVAAGDTAAEPALARSEVSRGAAFGDLDNDGDRDLLVGNTAGPARLLLSDQPAGAGGWLGVVPRTDNGAPVLAVEVAVHRAGEAAPLVRHSATDGSYCSASDPRLTVGLGSAAPAALELRWPGGPSRRILKPPAGRYLVVGPP